MSLKNKDYLVFQIVAYITIIIITVFQLIPFCLLLTSSVMYENDIISKGYSLFPSRITFEAYRIIFLNVKGLLNSYILTIFITLIGTIAGIFLTAMTGYVISRNDFKYKNAFSFFFYLTMLLNVPLIANYIYVTKVLSLKNNILVYFIGLLNAWFILLMRNYLKTIPEALSESAKIDGANDFYIFIKIIFPLSKPALASIGLFMALGYWNDWFTAMLFIENKNLVNLQYYLYDIINRANALRNMISENTNVPFVEVPSYSLRMAMAVVVTGPVIFFYPYLQKYFVKGLTVGAVKG